MKKKKYEESKKSIISEATMIQICHVIFNVYQIAFVSCHKRCETQKVKDVRHHNDSFPTQSHENTVNVKFLYLININNVGI